MTTLSAPILASLRDFSVVFLRKRSWALALTLLPAAVLLSGGRTVCRMLRFLGLKGEKTFDKYHKLLNRNKLHLLKGSKVLFQKLIESKPEGTTYIAADEHLERRRGSKIKSIGCFRDAVLSTKGRKVTSFGLKWLSFAVLKKFSWSPNTFAMPFMTVLTRSKESDRKAGSRHKTTTDWMCQGVKQISRWSKGRTVLITDGGLASVELAWACLSRRIHWITRLASNARLYDFPKERSGRGRPLKRGQKLALPSEMLTRDDLGWQKIEVQGYGNEKREFEYASFTCLRAVDSYEPVPVRITLVRDPMGEFDPMALMGVSHDMSLTPAEMIEGSISRWNIEVTFRECREHLGIETQRQWADKAIARCTPILFFLYSWILLLADRLHAAEPLTPRATAWYRKQHVTFSDAYTVVRQHFWRNYNFSLLQGKTASNKNSIPEEWFTLLDHLADCG